MTFFYAIIAFMVARILFGLIRHHGFRGMLFGADIESTLGEVSLESRGLITTSMKVHRIALDDADGPMVGLEVVSWSFASYQVLPLRLTLEHADELARLLRQATERRERSPVA